MSDVKDGPDRPDENKHTDDLMVKMDEWPMTKGWSILHLNPITTMRMVRDKLRWVRRRRPRDER